MDTNALKEALKQAERAVAEMPEGDLRVEAFKIILNRVLAESGSQVPTQKDAGNAPHREKSRTRQRRGDSHEGVVPRSVPARILTLEREGFFAERRRTWLQARVAQPLFRQGARDAGRNWTTILGP